MKPEEIKQRREEIREGVITNITKACPQMVGGEILVLADKILKDETSQGVVIADESEELPRCDVEYNPLACGAEDDTDNCYRGGWDEGQGVMLKAGFHKTYKLVEE